MRYSASQHLRMAAALDELSSKAHDPALKKRRLDLANDHRVLARKAAEQALRSGSNRDSEYIPGAG